MLNDFVLLWFSLTRFYLGNLCWNCNFGLMNLLFLLEKWIQHPQIPLLHLDYVILAFDIYDFINPKWFLPYLKPKVSISPPIILNSCKRVTSLDIYITPFLISLYFLVLFKISTCMLSITRDNINRNLLLVF